MLCPVCKTTELKMTDRQGIEIDYCPQCRGVWLDRGELDKLIERSSADQPTRPVSSPAPAQSPTPHYHDTRDSDDYYKKKKKKSMWGDIFDFD